jgi:hypothetical protein
MSTDFYVLLRLKKCGKSNNIFLLLNYMINFISNFTVEMLLKYNGIHWDSYPTIKKMGHQKDNLFYLIYKLSNDKGTKWNISIKTSHIVWNPSNWSILVWI